MSHAAVEHYLSEHTHRHNAGLAPWLLDQQSAAIETFRQYGFPSPRLEEWKYTDVLPMLKRDFRLSTATDLTINHSLLEAARFAGLDTDELVFINGHSVSAPTRSETAATGILLMPLRQALATHSDLVRQHLNRYADPHKNGFSALNTAFIQDGAAIIIPDGTTLEKPVHLVYLSDNRQTSFACNPRNLLILGKHSRATIIETYIGTDEVEYFTNTTTEISLDEGADLEHYKLQHEGEQGFHIGNMQVNQKRDSRFLSHSISLGAKLARNDIDVRLPESGAEVILNGLYMADRTQHVDNHTRIDHLSPHTGSNETYRGVLAGHSRGVFNGKVIVHKDAQKTSAHQSNANLLLSNTAEVDTKPELEIYADDVKCSHGATIGRLDENMLFYLRTRAIDADIAKSLLIFAFAEDVISRIQLTPIRNRLEHKVAGHLPDADLIREFVR